jgi:hypothetical protein
MILISIRQLDLLAVIDPDRAQVVWTWGPGQLQRQHHARLLTDGNISVFDNGVHRKAARALIVDPRAGKIIRSYGGSKKHPMYTYTGGRCQGLPNGNMLIVETERRRALEVTRQGKVVWEFFMHRSLNSDRFRRSLFFLKRIDKAQVKCIRS